MDEERYPSIYKGGKTYCRIMVQSCCGVRDLKVKMSDVARYYWYYHNKWRTAETRAVRSLHWQCSLRSLAGFYGDWREMDYLAEECLEYFKEVNVVGMRKAAKQFNLTPKF